MNVGPGTGRTTVGAPGAQTSSWNGRGRACALRMRARTAVIRVVGRMVWTFAGVGVG